MKSTSKKDEISSVASSFKCFKYVWQREANGKIYTVLRCFNSLLNILLPLVFAVFPGFLINELTSDADIKRVIIYASVIIGSPVIVFALNRLIEYKILDIYSKFNNNSNKIFALCGDAELHEGQIWETVQQAAHFKLDNLVAIIDNNGLSSHDPVNEVINLGSLEDKFNSFNWNVITVKDGNNMKEVVEALDKLDKLSGKPVAIIMKTVKGKGVSFLENNPNCHSLTISDKDFEQVKKDLDM